MSDDSVMVYLARFISGRPMNGKPRSNATFLHSGNRSLLAHRDRPSKWASLPGYKRAMWRVGVTVPIVANPIGLMSNAVATYIADGMITAAFTTYGTYRARKEIRRYRKNRQWVHPLHHAINRVIGHHEMIHPDEYLSVPDDMWTSADAELRVTLPRDFGGDMKVKREIERIIREKLALSDTVAKWHIAGSNPYVSIRQAPRPPERVTINDMLVDGRSVMDIISSATDSAPIMGIGHRGKVVSVDLDNESPHVLLSMATGAGKSAMTRLMVMQQLAKGARIVVCDIKKTSHMWLRGMPNVHYARSVEEIHDALISINEEGMRRYETIQNADADDYVFDGQRVILVFEEFNAGLGKLKSYWSKIKEKGDQNLSPAIEAFNDILFMGRAAKIHVIAIGQLATAKALGGPEAREQFGTRILGRYSVQAWKMLVPEIWPAPKKSAIRGRVQVVIGGEASETQVIFVSDKDAKAYVRRAYETTSESLANVFVVDSAGTVTQDTAPLFIRENRGVATQGQGKPGLRSVGTPIGLREATTITGMSLTALRSARARDVEFPQSIGHSVGGEKLYRSEDLSKWARNRTYAKAEGQS